MEPPNHHPYNPPTAAWLPRGSCHQALWPSAFAAPGLQPALCLHRQPSSIAACPLPAHSPLLLGHSSLPFASLQALKPSAFAAPGLQPALCLHRQPSSIAACPLPAHSPLLLGHSSLPFASLQTLKTPKTLHRMCGTSKSPPLQSSNCCMASSRQLPPSPLAVSLCCSRVAACALPAPSAFQHCSLPFACT